MPFIDSFPLDKPRDGQIILCDHLDRTTKSNAIIHIAPTGIGKSALAVAVARHSGSAYIISPNRSHVDQYESEYPSLSVGRSAADHKCIGTTNADPSCQYASRRNEKYCAECPYVKERNAYLDSSISVSTIAYLIARVQNPIKEHPMYARHFIIIDEIHKLEDDLIRHCGLSIRVQQIAKLGLPAIPIPPVPEPKPKTKYRETNRRDHDGTVIIPYIQRILQPALELRIAALGLIKPSVGDAKFRDAQKELEHLMRLVDRIPYYFNLRPSEIVAWVELGTFGEPVSIQVKPFAIAYLYHKLIEPYGHRMLGLSATIASPTLLVERLGLAAPAPGEKIVRRVESPFPPENHSITYINCGRMIYDEQDATVERMIPVIRDILKHHSGQRGIIHGHTNKLSKRLFLEFGDRLILAASSGDDAVEHTTALIRHRQKKDSVLISPSMTEGVDLRGDDSVFQILIKVPFPPFGEPWISAHKSAPDGSLWYSSQTASIIIQALGRSLRTMTDCCSSYILDGSFEEFFRGSVYGTDYPHTQYPNSHFFPQPMRSMLQDAVDRNYEERSAKELESVA